MYFIIYTKSFLIIRIPNGYELDYNTNARLVAFKKLFRITRILSIHEFEFPINNCKTRCAINSFMSQKLFKK